MGVPQATWNGIVRVTYKTNRILIRSFADKETELIFLRRRSRRLPYEIQVRAYSKLMQLDVSSDLSDLAALPGNRLEQLRGSRRGQYSIRVNIRYRICFVWLDGDCHQVEIVDYH